MVNARSDSHQKLGWILNIEPLESKLRDVGVG